MPRKYPLKDLKLLWGLSAGRCAFPGCKQLCAAKCTESDPTVVLGIIAHIIAHSDEGPRANPGMSADKRDCYENWILLCPTHHELIDAQPNTHTAEALHNWRDQHEQWVQDSLSAAIPSVTFIELEMIAQSIIHLPAPEDEKITFVLTNPREKMSKNGLTNRVFNKVAIGLLKAREVQDFVNYVSMINPTFSEKLKAGIIQEYEKLSDQGLEGDSLFEALHERVSPHHKGFEYQSAGLAVLSYLFEKCDLFEP